MSDRSGSNRLQAGIRENTVKRRGGERGYCVYLCVTCHCKSTASMSLDWDLVDQTLQKHIDLQLNITTGFYELKNLVKSETSYDLFENVDEGRMQQEFNDWLSEVFNNKSIPKKIKSIYFGLFTMVDPEFNSGQETTNIHVCGSTSTPSEDEDWACEAEWLPENRYLVLSDFITLDNNMKSKVKGDGALEILIFNGMLNLLVSNSIDTMLKHLRIEKKLVLGAGYDAGEPYVIGSVSTTRTK